MYDFSILKVMTVCINVNASFCDIFSSSRPVGTGVRRVRSHRPPPPPQQAPEVHFFIDQRLKTNEVRVLLVSLA